MRPPSHAPVKPAELVAHKHDPEQEREVGRAKNLRHDPTGQRHGAEPKQPHQRAEHNGGHICHRGYQDDGHQDGAQHIDQRQHAFLAELVTQRPEYVGTCDIAKPDGPKRIGRRGRGDAIVLQIRWEMGADKRDVEPADEEPSR